MLAPPSTKLLQAYRKPGTSPKAVRRKTYSPPASGSSAPSSAKHSAPNIATMPAASHAASTSAGVPTACAMAADLRKMPVPMMMPTTSEVACVSVRSRRSCSGGGLTRTIVQSRAAQHGAKTMAGHEYRAVIHWARGTEPFTDNRYSRAHSWRFDGGVEVPASSSPHVVRLPMSVEAAVDPEEALVAALSSCHMLWFLSLAASGGWRVDDYQDEAAGVMGKNAAGRNAMVRATLRPR